MDIPITGVPHQSPLLLFYHVHKEWWSQNQSPVTQQHQYSRLQYICLLANFSKRSTTLQKTCGSMWFHCGAHASASSSMTVLGMEGNMIRLYAVDNHVKIVAKRNQVSIYLFRKCVKV